jgi:pimeloyl-ACP methyl ester carboxylesterase
VTQHTVAEFLCPPGFRGPQGLGALARELSLVLEAGRLAQRRVLSLAPSCLHPNEDQYDGEATHPVLLIPGFLAGDYTLRAMSAHLRSQGHRTYKADMIANVGCLDHGTHKLEARIEEIAERTGERVALVGHSLGGLMARGLAARRPDLVSGIVTMGSPLLAPAAVHQMLLLDIRLLKMLSRLGTSAVMGDDCTTGACAKRMWDESRTELPHGFAFTSIYSKRDGIMDWRACLDESATHVRVPTSHIGMAIDPIVFDIVTDSLAQIRARSAKARHLSAVPAATAS